MSEAVLLATMTSGRILTFVGDVSRTSNALNAIQVRSLPSDLPNHQLTPMTTRHRNGWIWNQPTSRQANWPEKRPERTSLFCRRAARSSCRSSSGMLRTISADFAEHSSHNVELRYPSRPDALALNGVSVTFQPGMTYAFCGPSGSGKSR